MIVDYFARVSKGMFSVGFAACAVMVVCFGKHLSPQLAYFGFVVSGFTGLAIIAFHTLRATSRFVWGCIKDHTENRSTKERPMEEMEKFTRPVKLAEVLEQIAARLRQAPDVELPNTYLDVRMQVITDRDRDAVEAVDLLSFITTGRTGTTGGRASDDAQVHYSIPSWTAAYGARMDVSTIVDRSAVVPAEAVTP